MKKAKKADIREKKGPTKSTDIINVELCISYNTEDGKLLDEKGVEECLKRVFDTVEVKSIKHFTNE